MPLTQENLAHNYSIVYGGREGELGHEFRALPLGQQLTVAQAYAVNAETVAQISRQLAAPLAGFKVSMTNAADQTPVNASEPAYGLLTTVHLGTTGHVVQLDRANLPLVEPELVVRAVSELSPGMSDEEMAHALEATAGVEVPVCRIPGWWPEGQSPVLTLTDFLLDNAAAGFVVHADQWVDATALDLTALSVEVTDPGGDRHHGDATRVLGNPLNAVRWLTEALARSGDVVREGAIISSGTFMRPLRAVRGDYTAAFSHDLGTVTVRFD